MDNEKSRSQFSDFLDTIGEQVEFTGGRDLRPRHSRPRRSFSPTASHGCGTPPVQSRHCLRCLQMVLHGRILARFLQSYTTLHTADPKWYEVRLPKLSSRNGMRQLLLAR